MNPVVYYFIMSICTCIILGSLWGIVCTFRSKKITTSLIDWMFDSSVPYEESKIRQTIYLYYNFLEIQRLLFWFKSPIDPEHEDRLVREFSQWYLKWKAK